MIPQNSHYRTPKMSIFDDHVRNDHIDVVPDVDDGNVNVSVRTMYVFFYVDVGCRVRMYSCWGGAPSVSPS